MMVVHFLFVAAALLCFAAEAWGVTIPIPREKALTVADYKSIDLTALGLLFWLLATLAGGAK